MFILLKKIIVSCFYFFGALYFIDIEKGKVKKWLRRKRENDNNDI